MFSYTTIVTSNATNALKEFAEVVNSGASATVPNAFHVDVRDVGDKYILEAELAGVKRENISLRYKENQLIISVRQELAREREKTTKYLYQERYKGNMVRSFHLENIDETRAVATFKDGILLVTIPKRKDADKGYSIHIASV